MLPSFRLSLYEEKISNWNKQMSDAAAAYDSGLVRFCARQIVFLRKQYNDLYSHETGFRFNIEVELPSFYD